MRKQRLISTILYIIAIAVFSTGLYMLHKGRFTKTEGAAVFLLALFIFNMAKYWTINM